ncbi:DUF4350 domain-containing protein [Tahibacter sp.]|uniref:DUF4350 domain-containing protein n=1 Tax=Tahibacter sp. TaxID=2056211 RepID=UPI0028C4F86B|nr:DUF4350 domain-containing protein [Tahibacter sp.]
MMRRNLIIGGVASLLLGLIVFWFLTTYHRVEREIDLPPRGEARYNPLLALKKTLQARNLEASSRGDLNLTAMALQPGDAVLLDIDVRNLTDAQSETLMSWVESGGHLLLRLPEGDEGRPGTLLETLGLTVSSEFGCLTWSETAAKEPGAVQKPRTAEAADAAEAENKAKASKGEADPGAGMFCSRFRFKTEAEYESDFDWLWGNRDEGFLFGRHPWGEGDVLIAAEFDFLHNDALKRAGNAALTWQLLGPALGAGRVFLVYAADTPPWYVLFVKQGWYVLLPLLLALLAWLWARSQRFGPLLPLAPPHRRALLSHVQAAGEFAFVRGRGAALHAAVLRAFRLRLRRRDPVAAALATEALVQTLSERHSIAAARIRHALQPQELARPEQFLAAIRTLMQLRALI